MNRISIPLRHSWQENPELLDVHLMEPRQRCGLASIEMLIEYYLGRPVPAEEIFRRAESYQAVNEHNDWWHPGQVRVLASYGILAWRRNWTAPTQNPQYFADHEGYGPEQMEAVSKQIASESTMRANSERLVMALRRSLAHHCPVLLSVKSGFSKNSENHQILISGWDPDALTYEVHDPVHQSGPDVVTELRLLEYANYWAIFTRPGVAPDGVSH